MEIDFDINVAVANVTWAMVTGERSGSKGEIRPLLEAVNRQVGSILPDGATCVLIFIFLVNRGMELASTSAVLLFMPFLAKVFPERYLGIDQIKLLQRRTQGLLQGVIDEHKDNYQEQQEGDDESRDFIDAFLAEMKKGDAHESFEELQLLVIILIPKFH